MCKRYCYRGLTCVFNSIPMKKTLVIIAVMVFSQRVFSQDRMTPESLWKLGRVSAVGISADGKSLEYSVSTPSMADNKISSKQYRIPVAGGPAVDITGTETLVKKKDTSPDGKFNVTLQDVKIKKVAGKDFYPESISDGCCRVKNSSSPFVPSSHMKIANVPGRSNTVSG